MWVLWIGGWGGEWWMISGVGFVDWWLLVMVVVDFGCGFCGFGGCGGGDGG